MNRYSEEYRKSEERRLIRIYEAQLALLKEQQERSRKRKREEICEKNKNKQSSSPPSSWEEQHQSSDLLETLDALQAGTATTRLEQRWHDDPLAFRLLSVVGGIMFTNVSGPKSLPMQSEKRPIIEDAAGTARTVTSRIFSFEGMTVANDERGDHIREDTAESDNASEIQFEVHATVEIEKDLYSEHQEKDRARVVAIDSKFIKKFALIDNFSPQEELDMISKVASESCDLPQMYRQLGCFEAFDAARSRAFARWSETYGGVIERLTAVDFRLIGRASRLEADSKKRESRAGLTLNFRWQWSVSSVLDRGNESLRLICCDLGREPKTESERLYMARVNDSKGLEDLQACAGSSEKTIEMLLKTIHYVNKH